MSAKNFVVVSKLTKKYGEIAALDDVSISIGKGEFFSILGPSGSGKSTLLRLLGGFEQPTSGFIEIDGLDQSGISSDRRPTNMVFQNYALFPHLTVAENIAYGLRKQKLVKTTVNQMVEEYLEYVRLPGMGRRSVNELSGGQKQRIALARALIMRPKVLLLDEPMGALDKQLRKEMQGELRNIQREFGITFLLVTHDQDEALALSDRVAIMAEGKVLQIDTPENIYERPNSIKVAKFVGNTTMIDAHVLSVDGESISLQIGNSTSIMAKSPVNQFTEGQDVVVSLRPEHIKISAEPHPEYVNNIAGHVTSDSYLGNRAMVDVQLEGSDKKVTVCIQQVDLKNKLDGLANNKVWLGFDDSVVNIFPN